MPRKFQIFEFAIAAGIWVPASQPTFEHESDAEQALTLFRTGFAEIREVLV